MDDLIKAEFVRVWDESKRLNRRIEVVEEELKSLKEINLSIQKLAINMENMNKEQAKLAEAVEEIKARPAQTWNTITQTALTGIVSAVAGGFAVVLVQMIASGM